MTLALYYPTSMALVAAPSRSSAQLQVHSAEDQAQPNCKLRAAHVSLLCRAGRVMTELVQPAEQAVAGPGDKARRKHAAAEKAAKLKSPNFCVSSTRLHLANMPKSLDDKALKQLLITAVSSPRLCICAAGANQIKPVGVRAVQATWLCVCQLVIAAACGVWACTCVLKRTALQVKARASKAQPKLKQVRSLPCQALSLIMQLLRSDLRLHLAQRAH